MAAKGHSHEQGLRVHHLANLGGLIALADLDREPPDFLLGALISVAQESANLGAVVCPGKIVPADELVKAGTGGTREWRSANTRRKRS